MILLLKIIIFWLSAYGISFMLVYTSGPFKIFSRIRKLGGKISPSITELLSCMFCTPTWVGMIASFLNLILFPMIPFTPAFLLINNIKYWYLILFLDMLSTPSIVHLIDVCENLIDKKANE